MKKAYIPAVLVVLLICIVVSVYFFTVDKETVIPEYKLPTSLQDIPVEEEEEMDAEWLYRQMELEDVVNYEAFCRGIAGFNRITSRNKEILALIDYSKPCTEKRLFIFDLKNKEILYVTYVSHGMNSGEKYATSFSNKNGSYKSSLGFFLTGEAYDGLNGYSLVLEGLEAGINDQVKERYIVIHGASYTHPQGADFHKRMGWGRSLGCPAIPEEDTEQVIDLLKEGAVLYIFAENQEYFSQSEFHS